MGYFEGNVAAATAVVSYDLLVGKQEQQVGYDRVLMGIALKGSAAGADTVVDVFVDTLKIGTLVNTSTGVPNMDDMKPLRARIPANSRLHMYVVDAPSTNPINYAIMTTP